MVSTNIFRIIELLIAGDINIFQAIRFMLPSNRTIILAVIALVVVFFVKKAKAKNNGGSKPATKPQQPTVTPPPYRPTATPVVNKPVVKEPAVKESSAQNQKINNHKKIVTTDATVISKRTHSLGNKTKYYGTFETLGGKKIELLLTHEQFFSIIEGDLGQLSMQGDSLVSFEKVNHI